MNMKTLRYEIIVLFSIVAMFLLSSCDSNKKYQYTLVYENRMRTGVAISAYDTKDESEASVWSLYVPAEQTGEIVITAFTCEGALSHLYRIVFRFDDGVSSEYHFTTDHSYEKYNNPVSVESYDIIESGRYRFVIGENHHSSPQGE